MHLKLGKSVWS